MIPEISVNLKIDPYLFDEYILSDDELIWLLAMASDGYENDAVDIFMEKYINSPSVKYQNMMSMYLRDAEVGVLSEEDRGRMLRNVTLTSLALSNLLSDNFKLFVEKVFSITAFKTSGLTDPEIKDVILKEALAEHEQFISGSLTQTEAFIRNGIQTLQREMITENVYLKKQKITGQSLNEEIAKFKQNLRVKYPDLYNGMENGNILISKKFGPDGESVLHYKLDYYADMSVRSTLLNVDRVSNETMARVNDEKVVDYYQADPRHAKKDREICKEIIGKLTLGKSLLALDTEAAIVLGIMTIDEAKETPDYAMGPNCRHTFRRCSKEFLDEIDKIVSRSKGEL